MPSFDYTKQPEFREYCQAVGQGLGLEAELRPLNTWLDRARTEGDSEDVYRLLFMRFLAYCRPGHREGAVATLHQLDELQPSPVPHCEYLIADKLLSSLGAPDLAEGYVVRGFAAMEAEPDSHERYEAECRLTAVHVAVLVAKGTSTAEIAPVLERLAELGVGAYSETLVHALEQLQHRPDVDEDNLKEIVADLWGVTAESHVLRNGRHSQQLSRLEAIWRNLGGTVHWER